MQLFWLSFGFGLVTASVLAISAVGLSLQFGITNYINFAYGDFMALGAYITYVLNNEVLHWNIWVALIVGSLADGRLRRDVQPLHPEPFRPPIRQDLLRPHRDVRPLTDLAQRRCTQFGAPTCAFTACR